MPWQIHEFILNQFAVLWDEYAAARGLIPDGNLVEMSYAELARDPTATIGRIYGALGLEGFEARMRARCDAELRAPAVKQHRVNQFGALPEALRAIVAKRWAAYTEAWGYEWPASA